MNDQPDEELNSKFILIVFVSIFAWMTIGNLLSYTVTKLNMRHIHGKASDVKKIQYDCLSAYAQRLALCEKLELRVEGFKPQFVIAEYANPDIGLYVLDINKGDTVDIYVKKWYQWLFNFGRFHQIEYLEKGGETYYYNVDHPKYWIFFGVFGLIIFVPLLYIEINSKRLIAEGKLD